MKPATFAYEAPSSVERALALIGEDARPLAGGQSLVPMLNFRLARPELLVDLGGVASLASLTAEAGALRIGAMVTQATLQRSSIVAERWPLLRQAVRFVGHPATRSRGTVGGSAAHADPAAELPVALVALGARFHIRSRSSGERVLAAGDFFRGALTTALEADELLTEISVPALPAAARTAFVEQARTHGDFATAGAAVAIVPGQHAAVALLGAGSTPIRAVACERALLAGAGAAEAAALAGELERDEYRAALLSEVVRRALEAVLRA